MHSTEHHNAEMPDEEVGRLRRWARGDFYPLTPSEAGRDAIRNSLTGDVIRAYFELQAIDRRREVALRTLDAQRQSFDMQKVRYDAGAVSELELRQVEAERAAAEALVPRLEQQRVSQEGVLAILLGRSPREVYLYQVADNEECMRKYGAQAVVWQTAVNPLVALELIAAGTWQGAGVLGPEAFDPRPFLNLLPDYGAPWHVREQSA